MMARALHAVPEVETSCLSSYRVLKDCRNWIALLLCTAPLSLEARFKTFSGVSTPQQHALERINKYKTVQQQVHKPAHADEYVVSDMSAALHFNPGTPHHDACTLVM